MRKTKEEKNLLAKLASGALDGPVGNLFECGDHKKVYYGKYIKDGVPVSYREGEYCKMKKHVQINIKQDLLRYLRQFTNIYLVRYMILRERYQGYWLRKTKRSCY